MAEDEGVVVRDDGDGAVGVVTDQEAARFVERGRLAAPKGSIRVHARAICGRILCVRIGVCAGGLLQGVLALFKSWKATMLARRGGDTCPV